MVRIFLLLLLSYSSFSFSQIVEVTDKGETAKPVGSQTGAEKVRDYFKGRSRKPNVENSSSGAAPRYLALHIGTFFDDQAYKWGHGDQSDIGKLNFGVTYRLGEWINSADFAFRMDFMSYGLDEESARKISFSGIVTFPDANSKFPLYFGGGIGAGIFIKQVDKESALSFDYSILAGARVFDLIDSVGFMFEMGLKNHIHLLSDGQFNGVFVNVGTVFSF